jgi:hypothetical protein
MHRHVSRSGFYPLILSFAGPFQFFLHALSYGKLDPEAADSVFMLSAMEALIQQQQQIERL